MPKTDLQIEIHFIECAKTYLCNMRMVRYAAAEEDMVCSNAYWSRLTSPSPFHTNPIGKTFDLKLLKRNRNLKITNLFFPFFTSFECLRVPFLQTCRRTFQMRFKIVLFILSTYRPFDLWKNSEAVEVYFFKYFFWCDLPHLAVFIVFRYFSAI